jgi:cholesterol oxidase
MKRRNFVKLSALTGMAYVVQACKKETSHETIYTPNLIIGSGFGGSVTALRLSQAGKENILVERGLSWENHNFCEFPEIDERTTWLNSKALVPIINLAIPIKKYLGVIEAHQFKNMNLFCGAGLGGGSLTFGAAFVKPLKYAFEYAFPSEISYDELDEKYFTKVQQEIPFSDIPEDIYESKYYMYARTFRQHAQNAGFETVKIKSAYDWNIVRNELNGKIPLEFLKGTGNYGTRNKSKYSLDKNYLAKAVALKTKIYTQTNIEYIQYNSDKKYEIFAKIYNPYGQTIGTKTFIADKVFLCAGTPNTVKLLLKSKIKYNLKNLNDEVGKGAGTNGKVFFRRTVKEDTGRYTAWAPAEASVYFNNAHAPIVVENIPQPLGLVLPLPDLKSHFHAALGIPKYRGTYSYDEKNDSLVLDWSKNGLDDVIDATKEWAEKTNNANPDSFVDSLLISNQYLNSVSYHPLGGCVIGKATDWYGRIVEYPNLYVNDGTLLPGVGACSNPAYTIAAIAERNIEKIINEDY